MFLSILLSFSKIGYIFTVQVLIIRVIVITYLCHEVFTSKKSSSLLYQLIKTNTGIDYLLNYLFIFSRVNSDYIKVLRLISIYTQPPKKELLDGKSISNKYFNCINPLLI